MVLIRIKEGHVMNGDGEKIGNDLNNAQYTFWKNMGSMEVPLEIAVSLEKENPQRYEIVDRILAEKILKMFPNLQADPNLILDQVEKAYALKKDEQKALLIKLGIVPDKQGHEFDRVRKIILSGHIL